MTASVAYADVVASSLEQTPVVSRSLRAVVGAHGSLISQGR